MHTTPYAPLVGAAVVLVILALRLRRMSRSRRLRVEWLWVFPAILVVVAALVLYFAPPGPRDWPWMAGAVAFGAGLGWYRGRAMEISVDARGQVAAKASPAAMLFIAALVLIKVGLRSVTAVEADAWQVDPVLITDASLALAVGLMAASRVEMWLRARRLVAVARSRDSARGVG